MGGYKSVSSLGGTVSLEVVRSLVRVMLDTEREQAFWSLAESRGI